MKTKLGLVSLGALLALGVGCESYDWGYANRTSEHSYTYSSYSYAQPSPAQPNLGLSDERVDAALAERQQVEAARRAEFQAELVSARPPETVFDVAARIDECFRAGQRDLGLAIAAEYENVATFDELAGQVLIDCRYRGVAGGVIELTMERSGDVAKPLAVVLPPGTYGQPVTGPAPSTAEEALELADLGGEWNDPDAERRYRDWPSAQDLAFLRAPVVAFAPGQTRAQVRVPIACAAFDAGPPQAEQPYTLARFTAGSEIDRLMVYLCAEEEVPAAETQLAVWLTRNDITWDQFCAQGGNWGRLATFGNHGSVMPGHAGGAARLMLESGLDPRGLSFFADQAPQALEAQSDVREEPQADEQPAQEPAQPQGEDAEVELEAGDLS